MSISFPEVSKNVSVIANRSNYDKDVIFELLSAYGRSSSSITKLRNGINNLAEDKENDVLQRGVLYFKYVKDGSLLSVIEKMEQDPLVARYNPRYIITSDYKELAAKDTKKGETRHIKLQDLDRNVDFFFAWTGNEIHDEKTELVADRRAADNMKELYIEVKSVNQKRFDSEREVFRHHLNVFFTRLLFCFFAEDTNVFREERIFTNSIKDFTQTDGSDLSEFLKTLFESLDVEDKSKYASPFSKFPYVNGSLFSAKHKIVIPHFNAQARKLILECGALSWAEINPDIFGSMFQGIVDEESRASHGMHYTSVPNILKVIEPLFMNELREEFDKSFSNPAKLSKLHLRISKIKVFDPACGSGNFLIIAYKEIRRLEHAIMERIIELNGKMEGLKLTSSIKLENFYGIEIDDFAHEVAVLSLYLAKHQMNKEFEKQFGKEIILIPLKDKANIYLGNAARIDWQDVCPNKIATSNANVYNQILLEIDGNESVSKSSKDNKSDWEEIYVIGNPPYQGFLQQDKNQKNDLDLVFGKDSKSRKLDYISCWFVKGSNYIHGTKAELAFVSTNSITQGEQVVLLWPGILNNGLEIGFAYTSFKWSNSAKANAGVSCVIVNLRNVTNKKKFLIDDGFVNEVERINPYLVEGDTYYIVNRNKPLSELPKISLGSSPYENGNLILSPTERTALITIYPEAEKLIRKFIGSSEFINGEEKYCLWIEDKDLIFALSIPPISKRIDLVRKFRGQSNRVQTKETANKSYKFTEIRNVDSPSLIIPIVTSERRYVLPIGFLDERVVIPNSARAVYNADLYLFTIITSRMHMVWTKSVAGKLETRIRYSAVVYNSFPIPTLDEQQKDLLRSCAKSVLFARENHSEKTIGEMYDPITMPDDLKNAQNLLDKTVDELYRKKPYESDKERLADLFKLYEKMVINEQKNESK